MPTITVKNIPAKLHQKLKQNASHNHRSLNNEIIACLESSVSATPINSELLLVRARKIRSKISGHLTEETLHEFKNQGRL